MREVSVIVIVFMSSGVYDCIILTNREWFDKCLERNCSIFHFPPGRKPKVHVLPLADVCLVLIRQSAFRKDWLFIGEFTVKTVKPVKGEEFSAYMSKSLLTMTYKHINERIEIELESIYDRLGVLYV